MLLATIQPAARWTLQAVITRPGDGFMATDGAVGPRDLMREPGRALLWAIPAGFIVAAVTAIAGSRDPVRLLIIGFAVSLAVAVAFEVSIRLRDSGLGVRSPVYRARNQHKFPQTPLEPTSSDLDAEPLGKRRIEVVSREEMYRALCTYMYGMGVTNARREVIVDDDGAVEVLTSQSREIHVPKFRRLGGFESWAAAIVQDSVDLSVPEHPPQNSPVKHVDFELAEIDGKAVPNGKLKWLVEFPDPLDVETTLTVALRYRAAAEALKQNYYLVSVSMPMKRLEVIIRPRDQKRRRFVRGMCFVEGLDQERDYLRDQEESRSQPQAVMGGYRVALDYPLLGSRLKITWQSVSP